MADYDALIIGGGPAGLSAALVLGRCRRRVLLCDAGKPRNRASKALHGFLTRDGVPPLELLTIARKELSAYRQVELVRGEAVAAERINSMFRVLLADGREATGRKLLLATGLKERLPAVEGLAERLGRSVFHCPYCDAWELRDKPLAVYAEDDSGPPFARMLGQWTRDVVLCAQGRRIAPAEAARLARLGVKVRTERLLKLEGPRDGPLRLVFASGPTLERRALFFRSAPRPATPFPEWLGAAVSSKGAVKKRGRQEMRVPGLFVAGDATRDVELAIVAAAEGAKAAFAINTELLAEDGRGV